MSMDILSHAIGSVLTLFIIGAVGYVLARKGWFTPEATALLPKLVTLVALPAFMLYNITSSFDRDSLLHLVYGSLVPFVSIASCFILSLLSARALGVTAPRKGIFSVGFTASNTIFIGVPVNLALFGESALPYVLLYYFANTIFFWSIGNYMLAADGGHQEKIISKATFKQVFSPPMLGFLLGLLLLLLDLKLPFFVSDAAKYLGSLTTPLIIMFLGVMLQGVSMRNMQVDRQLLAILAGRFIVSPLSIVFFCTLLPLPELMRKVFIIQASLPTVTSLSLLASYYKSDPAFATVVVSATTALSIITIPLIMILVTL